MRFSVQTEKPSLENSLYSDKEVYRYSQQRENMANKKIYHTNFAFAV